MGAILHSEVKQTTLINWIQHFTAHLFTWQPTNTTLFDPVISWLSNGHDSLAQHSVLFLFSSKKIRQISAGAEAHGPGWSLWHPLASAFAPRGSHPSDEGRSLSPGGSLEWQEIHGIFPGHPSELGNFPWIFVFFWGFLKQTQEGVIHYIKIGHELDDMRLCLLEAWRKNGDLFEWSSQTEKGDGIDILISTSIFSYTFGTGCRK